MSEYRYIYIKNIKHIFFVHFSAITINIENTSILLYIVCVYKIMLLQPCKGLYNRLEGTSALFHGVVHVYVLYKCVKWLYLKLKQDIGDRI